MTLRRYLALAFLALGIVAFALFPELRSAWALILSAGGIVFAVFYAVVGITVFLVWLWLWRKGGRS